MTALLGFVIASVAGTLGLFIGCALGLNGRLELWEEIADLENEVERLRGRG
jgi:hypothetical protein